MFAVAFAVAVSTATAQAPDPDLNDDGIVNIYDVSMVSSCFGQDAATVPRCGVADTDGDGDVDMDDINYVVSAYGTDGYPVSSENRPPIANAGTAQTVEVGSTVSLDGSRSSDADGDPLTYSWSLVSVPAGSSASLSTTTGVRSTFVADLRGSYLVELIANDGTDDSPGDRVTITTTNSPPIADAGSDQSVRVGQLVTLDGSGSNDPDGDLLSFSWNLDSLPDSSSASLSDAAAVNPSFIADADGTYVIRLLVSDGIATSVADRVTVTTENTPPVANAGADRSVLVGQIAQLDGSGSTDADGNLLTFFWSFSTVPDGSAVELSDPTAVRPSFTVDVPGDYVVQLVVSDGLVDSPADTLVVSTQNLPPVADAGLDQSALVGDVVLLDGTSSTDPEFDPLTYSWALTSRPAQSSAALSDPTSPQPTLAIDRPGTYVVRLVVNDGATDSVPDLITIATVNSRPTANAGSDQEVLVGELVELDGSMSSDPDFDELTFAWAFTASPEGDTATLAGDDSVSPTFVPDAVGTYAIQLVVDDAILASNPDTVAVEAGPPSASILANPERGSVPLEVAFTAQMSGGFPPYGYAWDLNGDGSVDDTRSSFVQLYQSGGSYGVDLTITDARGFTATASRTIDALVAPQVVASASPSEGTAPLDVAFSAVASDADGSIVLYEWDFNGDGVIDQRSPNSASGAFRYDTAGLYEAQLTVTDNDGNAISDSVVISVGLAPELTASVSPLTGDAPLPVTFSASAEDPDGSVVRYDWDFDGDGIVDFTDPGSGDTTYTYDVGGIYPATVNVSDDTGLFATRTFVVSVAGPPEALPRAYPMQGEAPLTVTFFSDGTDIDGGPEYYDWDFNGDGSRDIRLIASMNTAYTYTAPGIYDAALTVVDNDGLSGTATVQIEVLPPAGAGTTPSAEALARPSNGGAPLTTSLIGEGDDPDGTIVEYAWDFQADGTYDFVDPVSGSTALGLGIDVGSYAAPTLLDMDGDGDRDLAIGNSNGQLLIYENRAEAGADAPVWASGQPLRDETDTVIDIGSYAEPAIDDIDGDGDHDLLVGNSSGQVYWLENTGGSAAPSWLIRDRITDDTGAMIDVGGYSNLLLLDYDADGDRDLLIGNSNGTMSLYMRGGTAQLPVWSSGGSLRDDTGVGIDVGSYAAPMRLPGASADEDALLVGNSSGQIRRFVNVGTAASPSWQDGGLLQTPGGSTIDVGSYANPLLFDLVADGQVHLMVGDSEGLLDIVTEQNGGWAQTQSGYNAFDVGGYSSPALADLDSDADIDLLTGNSDGQLYLRRNSGSVAMPAWFVAERLVDDTGAVIDIGSYAAPTLVDLDDDGDIDIVVGNSSGQLFFIRNDGDAGAPSWAASSQLTYSNGSAIDVGSYAAPVAGDFDRDGDIDLLVGNSSGLITYARNDGDSSIPSWVSAGNLGLAAGGTLDVGSYAYPAIYDPDRNGTLDLLVGNSDGQMLHFDNLVPFDFSLVASPGQMDGIDVGSYAAPAVADIDNDGDGDVFVGNSNGLMSLYPRYGQVLVEYTDPGIYTAVLRVTDNSGETATDAVIIDVLLAGSPSALASATPAVGDVPLTVQFSGQGIDADGSIVEYAWDFDGDGSFDDSSASDGGADHIYNTAGIFDAVLRVTDDSGLSATDQVRIEVGFVITPSIGTVSFNPGAGEVGTIQTVIEGGEALVTIRLLDGQGNLVRTLVNGALRGPGTYQDAWTGTDQNGQPVQDGPYYAVIEYSYNGETEVVDPREQAVFEELTPSRNFSSSFNPYEGDPVTVSYQMPWAAEVSLYFWTRDDTRPGSTIAPVRTVFLREARPAGSYSDVWDGFDDNGVVVEPGREYPVTLWLYRLPDNAILVTGNRPEITAITATPEYFNPSYNPYASGPAPSATLSLQTTKVATLQAEIVNGQGLLVRRITRANRPAGANALTWDGRDSDGNLVAPGTYSIGVTAIDAVGNRSLSRYAAVTVRY